MRGETHCCSLYSARGPLNNVPRELPDDKLSYEMFNMVGMMALVGLGLKKY